MHPTLDVPIKPVWLAYTTRDEQGTIGSLIGVASTQELAKVFAKDQGCYGGSGRVIQCQAITVAGLTWVLKEGIEQPVKMNISLIKSEQQEIEEAKKKLTSREKELLGIE